MTEHRAKRGIRRVFTCQACEKAQVPRKAALTLKDAVDVIPECPRHGPMVREANMPYLGQTTEPTKEQGWPPAVARVKERDEAQKRWEQKNPLGTPGQ